MNASQARIFIVSASLALTGALLIFLMAAPALRVPFNEVQNEHLRLLDVTPGATSLCPAAVTFSASSVCRERLIVDSAVGVGVHLLEQAASLGDLILRSGVLLVA
jgi:hypothetical protein